MTTVLLRNAALGLAIAGLGMWSWGSTPADAEELTVYTAIEADDLSKYAERFNKDHPDIEIQWVRDSTGIITAKLLAEKDNPQADIVWA
jgi:iron(III) transport system substrate-binding protein